jgi:hypothetical protein
MNPDVIAKFRARMEEIIRQHGFMVQAVFPTADDPDSSPFQYTIGLHERELPELVSIGLPGDVGHALLNDVAAVIAQRKEAGEPLTGEVHHDSWPMPFYLLAADASEAEEYATGARNRSSGQARYLQVCWPDKQGRFPWQADTEASYRNAQPLLGAYVQLH